MLTARRVPTEVAMRIIRFLGEDQQVHFGIPDSFPAARRAAVVHDPMGVLGQADPPDRALCRREIFGGRRALVADDDANMRELICTVLTKAGCICTACADGAEAVAVLESGAEIDLIVSDVVMPHHNGYEVFAAARRRNESIPVVLVTGFGYEPGHALVKATREGLRTVLYKPFTPQQLLDEIKQAMRDTLLPADALVITEQTIGIDRILAPLRPTTILGIGANWQRSLTTAATTPRETAADSAQLGTPSETSIGREAAPPDDLPEDMEVFMKPRSVVQDPGGPIRMPHFDDLDPHLACEGELAVVIGRGGTNIAPADVSRHVFGYTVACDVTARCFQTPAGPPLWMRGKGFDTFCPLGPAIVTGDELDIRNLTIHTLVNGRTVRVGSTADMIHPVESIVSEVSRHITLEPGTVILTGAPPLQPGSEEMDPTADLAPGDRVQIEIDGIGVLRHPVLSDDGTSA